MAFGESYVQRQARLDRQRKAYPELEGSDYDTIGKVDALRRSEGRPLTTFGKAVEDTYIGIQQEQYNPDTPDTAPNVEGWEPRPLGLNGIMSSVDEMRQGREEAERLRSGELTLQAPELTDPYVKRVMDNPLNLLDIGAPARGFALSALQGRSPIATPDYDPTAARGIDVPGIRSLPDRGVRLGPVNITPKTVGGFLAEAATDPTTYITGGQANALKGGLKDAAGKVFARGAKETTEAAVPRVAQMAGAGANEVGQMLPPTATGSASQRLFQIKPPTQPLSRFDRTLNVIKETVGIGVPEDEIATPIMRERRRVRSVIESQAARMGQVADEATRAFPLDRKGRIASLPGAPTIQDVAAKLPQYDQYLDDTQRGILDRLRREVEPYHDSLLENGIDVRSRADVMDGGFYLPRGRADLEGADAAVKVGTGRGGAGGRKGFEKGAVFESMSEGIDKGYEYASLKDAVQSYANDAGNRAIDAWAATEFKGTNLGETAKMRLLRQDPAIAKRKAALDMELSRLRSLNANLSDRQLSAIESFINDPNYESIDDLRAALPETVSRGANKGQNITQVRNALASVKQQIRDFRPDYNRALERARSTPRDQGSIGFAGLNGTSFPDEIANVANKYLKKEKPPSGADTQALNAVRAFNGLMRGLRASSDLSFIGIQGLLGATSHPKQYGEALWVAIRSLGDERAFGAFVNQFDDAARAAGRPDSRAWAAVGSRIGGSNTEFAIGKGLANVGPAIQEGAIPLTRRVPGLRNGINPVRGSNRAFGTFGDTLRLATADAIYGAKQSGGKAVTSEQMAEIAKFSNLMTGWSERRFLSDTGALVQFAPRFFQSQLDLVGNALTSKSITGQEARKSLAMLVGIGTLLTVGANKARGYENEFDPRKPNFMRIRNVAGTDVSLFGPWDSLVRGLAAASKGDLTYLARSKASPAVALAWDEISGKSFMGEDTRTPEYILRQFLPFSISDIGEKGLGTTLIGATGVKATPLSPTDRVQMGEFGNLKGEEQFKAIPSQAWKVATERAPEQFADARKHDSAYDFYQSLLEEYTQGWIDRGATRLEAQAKAERSAQRHPVYRAYIKARNHYEDEWTKQNPELRRTQAEAQLDLPPSERRNMPRKRERQIIEAAR